jgi:hypothetical protein
MLILQENVMDFKNIFFTLRNYCFVSIKHLIYKAFYMHNICIPHTLCALPYSSGLLLTFNLLRNLPDDFKVAAFYRYELDACPEFFQLGIKN